MSRYVESGVLDAGLTGLDWIAENNSDVHVVADLIYSKVSARPARWVIAVAYDSPVKTLEDLDGKTIATELVKYTQRYFSAEHQRQPKIFLGGDEPKPSPVWRTPSSRSPKPKARSRPTDWHIHEMMLTNTQLIVNHAAWKNPEKRER